MQSMFVAGGLAALLLSGAAFAGNDCEDQAAAKKLAGATKDSPIKKCVSDAALSAVTKP